MKPCLLRIYVIPLIAKVAFYFSGSKTENESNSELLLKFQNYPDVTRSLVWRHWMFWTLVLLAFLAIPTKSLGQSGKTFTVNILGDEEDPNAGEIGDDNLCDVDPNTPGEQCTFRAAIQNHNANRNLDLNTIYFNIDTEAMGLDRVIIRVGNTGLGPLPPILGAVSIQALNLGNPQGTAGTASQIELDGSMAGDNAIGLRLLGGDCLISFFVIHSFSSHGIFIGGTPPPGEGRHRLEANFIGTDITATEDKGNGGDGIFIEDTPDNIIGGTGVRRNIISGNEGYGIHIMGRDPDVSGSNRSGAPNNVIEGNYIGLDLFGQNVIPNSKGGVLIEDGRDIRVGGTEENKVNQIAGTQNGITIQGSLAQGIKVLGNFIGKEGAGAKFLVGILHRGKLVTIEGNLLTNIDSVGVDAFLNADGIYNIKSNRFEGKMKVGTKLTFGEGRTINVEYVNNFHTENGKGVEFEEAVKGNINWNVVGNSANLGSTGGSILIKANGTKNFTENKWELHAEAGFRYIAEIEKDVFATVTVTNEVYDRNGLDGVGIRATVKGDLAYAFLNTTSKNNGKDGVRLEAFGELGSQVTFEASQTRAELNGGAGFRIINGSTRLDLLRAHFEKDIIDGNLNGGIWILDGMLKFSILENTITNNGPFGIELLGGTLANFTGNTISGHQVGVNVRDNAEAALTSNTIQDNSVAGVFTQNQGFATMSNNILTANGTALALAGSGTGSSILGNTIFGNQGLGIDLGNDGVTPNDPGDADTGPNNLQNFPVLSQTSSSGGNTNIKGFLNSTPNSPFRLEFFSNTSCNPSGFGEGETFLGFAQVTTDTTGKADFSVDLNTTVLGGSFITATATDSANNTSEFAPCFLFGMVQLADLELTKEADQLTPIVGEQVTFTIKLTNKGPAGATGIVVKDVATAGLSFESFTPSQGSFDANTSIWTVGALSVGDSAALTIVATGMQEGILTNTAEIIASDQGDPDSSPNNGVENEDDQSSVSVNVQSRSLADLELTKEADQLAPIVGEQVTFTIKLTNKGPAGATGIAVKDVATAGLSFESFTPSQGSFDVNTSIWTVGALAMGDSAALTIVATVMQEGILTNTAEIITSDQGDPDSSPNNGVENEDDQSSISVEGQETASIEEQLILLIEQVEFLVKEGDLTQRQGKVLNVLLEVSLKQYNKGNSRSAISTLRAFNLSVKVLVKHGNLPRSEGEELILAADKIIEQIKMESGASRNNPKEMMSTLDNEKEQSSNLRLHTVYPNPFITSTTITFELVHESQVHLMIYSESGMKTVYEFNQFMTIGTHTLRWTPEHLPAGMYVIRVQAGKSIATSRMLRVK